MRQIAGTLVMVLAALAGCGGGGAVTGGAGGMGGSGGDGGTGGILVVPEPCRNAPLCEGGGGAGGTGGEPACGSAALAPFDCAASYPDAALAYDPAAESAGIFAPALGESPDGAAAGRVDVTEGTVAAVLLGVALGLPDAIRVAVWQEPACGIPATPGEALLWQDLALADVTADGGVARLPLPLPATLTPEAGLTWVALGMTEPSVTVRTVNTAAGAHEPRFAWLGLVDADCDGSNDAALGWEDIRTPSAKGVAAADADLVIGVELAP